jgi:hypothetical protein
MSKKGSAIRWWLCDPDSTSVLWGSLHDAIRESLKANSSLSVLESKIMVLGFSNDSSAFTYDPRSKTDSLLGPTVEGWVRSAVWAKKLGLAYGPLYETSEGPCRKP